MADEKKVDEPVVVPPKGVECVPLIAEVGWEVCHKNFLQARANDNPGSLRDAIANTKAMVELALMLAKVKK